MAIELRPVRREEVPVLWKMLRGLADYERMTDGVTGTPEMMTRLLFDPPGGLFGLIAWEGDRPLGYALYFDTFSSFRAWRTTWLEDLFVLPSARGTGAGRALLAEVARLSLERGSKRLAWDVLDWNEPAIKFYERQGAELHMSDWRQYRLDEGGMQRLVTTEAASR